MQVETIILPDVQRLEYWQEQWFDLFREQTTTDLSSSYQWLANDFLNFKKEDNRRCYIVHSNGVFRGAMVCEIQRHRLGARLSVPIVNTGSHFVSDFAIDNNDGDGTLAVLIEAIQNDFPHSAWINFERLTLNCFQHIQTLSARTHALLLVYGNDDSSVFDVDTKDFSAFTQSMSSKSKANLRYYERLLDRKIGSVVLDVVSPQSDDDFDSHYNQFLDIENSGWKGKKGTAITQMESSKEFHYALCKTAAKQGQLRWYKLYAGHQLITMNMAIQRASDLWIVKTAYDDNFQEFSPGAIGITKLLHSAVEDMKICKVRMITNYAWLDRWHPTKETYHGIRIFNKNLLGKIFYPLLKFLQNK